MEWFEHTLLYHYPVLWIPLVLTVFGAIYDLPTERIPNWLTGSIFLLAPITAAVCYFSDHPSLKWAEQNVWLAVLGPIVPLVLLMPGAILGKMGMGDVKLMAALGAWYGAIGIVVIFIWMALIGALMAAVVWIALRLFGRPGAKVWFRYGPAIGLAVILFSLWPRLIFDLPKLVGLGT
jgi:prepilin peptidase CpaA